VEGGSLVKRETALSDSEYDGAFQSASGRALRTAPRLWLVAYPSEGSPWQQQKLLRICTRSLFEGPVCSSWYHIRGS